MLQEPCVIKSVDSQSVASAAAREPISICCVLFWGFFSKVQPVCGIAGYNLCYLKALVGKLFFVLMNYFLRKIYVLWRTWGQPQTEDITTKTWSLIFLPRISSLVLKWVRVSCSTKINLREGEKGQFSFLRGLSSPTICADLDFGI